MGIFRSKPLGKLLNSNRVQRKNPEKYILFEYNGEGGKISPWHLKMRGDRESATRDVSKFNQWSCGTVHFVAYI